EVIRRMINSVVVDLIQTTLQRLEQVQPQSIDDVRQHKSPLVGLSDAMQEEHLELKQFLRERVYRHYRVLRMTAKARQVVQQLFEAFLNDIQLLPDEHREAARRAEQQR